MCPDLTIKTDVEMLLLMLFITEIKLLALEMGSIAGVRLGACYKRDFKLAWIFQLLKSVSNSVHLMVVGTKTFVC